MSGSQRSVLFGSLCGELECSAWNLRSLELHSRGTEGKSCGDLSEFSSSAGVRGFMLCLCKEEYSLVQEE